MKSVLLLCLFSGFASMVLPNRKGSEWLKLLLAAVILTGLIQVIRTGTEGICWDKTVLEETSVSETDTYREIFSGQIQQVLEKEIGAAPLRVESDLEYADGVFSLNEIAVFYTELPEEEVIGNALEKELGRRDIRIRTEKIGGAFG